MHTAQPALTASSMWTARCVAVKLLAETKGRDKVTLAVVCVVQVKVMIWNVHTGYADNGYDNYELSAAFLQDMGVRAQVLCCLASSAGCNNQTILMHIPGRGNCDSGERSGAAVHRQPRPD